MVVAGHSPVSTGYYALDQCLGGGLGPGECSLLFGASGVGKSTFMGNLALRTAEQGIPTAVISLEMPDREMLQLLLCAACDLERKPLRTGLDSKTGQPLTVEVPEAFQRLPLHILDYRTVAEHLGPRNIHIHPFEDFFVPVLRAKGIRVLFIDDLTKLTADAPVELERVPQITAMLNRLALASEAHIVVLQQSNKAAFALTARAAKSGGREPSLEDAKGSVECIGDMVNVLGIYPDTRNTKSASCHNVIKVAVLKARYGPGGETRLIFNRETGQVYEPETKTKAPFAGRLPLNGRGVLL